MFSTHSLTLEKQDESSAHRPTLLIGRTAQALDAALEQHSNIHGSFGALIQSLPMFATRQPRHRPLQKLVNSTFADKLSDWLRSPEAAEWRELRSKMWSADEADESATVER